MPVEIGMAGEFVLGMHGKLKYNGTRLAGLYPHKQVKLVEEAGASIFGAVVNTNRNKSFPLEYRQSLHFRKGLHSCSKHPCITPMREWAYAVSQCVKTCRRSIQSR